MPAAAVIPAPFVYAKVVAVKTLVVEPRAAGVLSATVSFVQPPSCPTFGRAGPAISLVGNGLRTFTVRKLECSKQASAVNTLAWNNGRGHESCFVGFEDSCND